MLRLLSSLAMVVTLGACAVTQRVGAVTMQDAQTAAAIDPIDSPCYNAIGTIGSTVANANGIGILTAIAVKKSVQGVLANPACAPIEAFVLSEILRATPAAPLIP